MRCDSGNVRTACVLALVVLGCGDGDSDDTDVADTVDVPEGADAVDVLEGTDAVDGTDTVDDTDTVDVPEGADAVDVPDMGDVEEPVTCHSAVEHAYAVSCTLCFDEEQPAPDPPICAELTREEALAGCDDWEALALERDCGTEWEDLLDCLAGIEASDCAACDDARATVDDCWADDVPSEPCPGYTGPDTTCCTMMDPCYRRLNGTCDCDGACPWDAADCS
ncbi:MAG: hypothetical protein JXB32_19370 [Deltaproteobacteria bacterium]|nr:hypothetical protein [Deltaproteobacteria bacterium]